MNLKNKLNYKLVSEVDSHNYKFKILSDEDGFFVLTLRDLTRKKKGRLGLLTEDLEALQVLVERAIRSGQPLQ